MGRRQIIVLGVDESELGIDIEEVDVIEKPKNITRVPGTPEFVEGIADIRGNVHTVIDLRKRLGRPGRNADEETRMIVLDTASGRAGFLADSVKQILTVDHTDIKSIQRAPRGMKKKFLKGAAIIGKRKIVLIDPEALLLPE